MMRSLILSSILIMLIVLGFNSPVMAQQPPPPILYIDAPSSVNISTEFDIIIWIHDVPDGFGIINVPLLIQFDPNDLEYIECEFLIDHLSWIGNEACDQQQTIAHGEWWTEDSAWWRYRFHCLRAGPTPITVSSASSFIIQSIDGGTSIQYTLEPVTVIVDQVAPVGGVASPINKLEILAPYIALAGVIAAVSGIYVIKKRRD